MPLHRIEISQCTCTWHNEPVTMFKLTATEIWLQAPSSIHGRDGIHITAVLYFKLEYCDSTPVLLEYYHLHNNTTIIILPNTKTQSRLPATIMTELIYSTHPPIKKSPRNPCVNCPINQSNNEPPNHEQITQPTCQEAEHPRNWHCKKAITQPNYQPATDMRNHQPTNQPRKLTTQETNQSPN